MTKTAAHTRAWETGEAVLGIFLLLGLGLGFLFPLPLSAYVPRAAAVAAGILLLLAGMAIISAARRQFREASQPTDPGSPTTALITGGAFSWSRNPLYLAGVLIFAGLAALLNSLWLVVLLVPLIIAVQMVLILPEERYLAANFGEPYRRYAANVHRWFGRRR